MRKHTIRLAIGLFLALALGCGASAAPSVLGISGNILTPDDTVMAPGGFNLGYHGITDVGDTNDTISIFAANLGVIPNLEIGAALATNGDSEFLLNAKYRILAENAARPTVSFGIVDAGSELTDDAGLYLLLSKNLTPAVEEIGGKPSRPLRGHLGIGAGPLKGIFFALDWTMTARLSLMLEFISDSEFPGTHGDSLFNGGIRYAVSEDLRLDLGLIDFEDFTFGIGYQALKY